jgi:2-hydroxy-3-oxopropionate reductase
MSAGIPREPRGAAPPGLTSDEGARKEGGASRAPGGERENRASGKAERTRIAFIGLGIMGAPMAANLVKAGFDVTGYNRSPARVEQLIAAGGRGAKDIAEAVREADVVATMVPDSPDVQAVLAGEGGVFENAQPGALIIDFSTIRPDVAAALAAEAAERGFRMLDAPVSGGEQGAIEGALSIMVGGATADFEAAAPVFAAVGKTIVHVGPSGSGQTVKAANQLMVAGHLELLAEAIIFLEAYGVEVEAALHVLGGGLAGSTVIQRKGAAMLARDFTPGFRIALHDKDMGIVTAAAREAGVVIPLGAVAAQLLSSLKAQGDGGLDHSALLKLVAQLSGKQQLSGRQEQNHGTDNHR